MQSYSCIPPYCKKSCFSNGTQPMSMCHAIHTWHQNNILIKLTTIINTPTIRHALSVIAFFFFFFLLTCWLITIGNNSHTNRPNKIPIIFVCKGIIYE